MKIDFESFRTLLGSDRSVRRFDGKVVLPHVALMALVELPRLCASSRNAQPLKYRIVDSEEEKERLFPLLAWAGYYKDWSGPAEGERPSAYLVQCLDTRISQNADIDCGIQLQAITLGAASAGISCCCIKAFDAAKAAEVLGLPEWAQPTLVIAMGKAAEEVRIVGMADDDFRYYRLGDIQCVPKRGASELLIGE